MDVHQVRRTLLLLLACSSVQYGWTELTACSDYLVSGLDGVQITAISASSSWAPTHDTKYARLYSAVNSQAWVTRTNDVNQYIQVTLPSRATVYAIILQGRGIPQVSQWVKTYFVSYSNDSVTWTDVTSPDGSPQVFTGNSDKTTIVKASIVPSITGMYIRIKPQTWQSHISLRFDVSGCYQMAAETSIGKETFSRIPIMTSSEFTEGLALEASATSLAKCTAMCKKTSTCLSFTYDKDHDLCRVFNVAAPGLYGKFSTLGNNPPCYLQTEKLATLGFRKLQGTTKQYKVMEVARNQSGAIDMCTQLSSRLIPVETVSEMTTLQNVIAGNDILRHNFQFYVSGTYVSQQWQYSGVPEVIGGHLWSSGNPDPSQGHCVMLTQTGLVSVDCTAIVFCVCGI